LIDDDLPIEFPPSIGYAAVARAYHAPGAHRAEEYHRPPGERDLLDDLAAGVTRTVVRPATTDTPRREVAL
jgi:hypothetical protein